MLHSIVQYLELIRFSHTLFALPFALLAGAMAIHINQRFPSLLEIIGFLGCMVFARSAAMAFNRWADRHLDVQNPRTADRHIPSGKISARAVLLFTAFCSMGFIASSCFFLPNPYPLIFSVPVLIWLFGYSYAKRFTLGVHFWLGSALALPPLAVWVALRPEWNLVPVLLSVAVIFWTAGFDILYACQDAEFDAKKRLLSIPARFGVRRSMQIAAGLHLMMIVLLLFLPISYPPLSPVFYWGIGISAALLAAEHWLVQPKRNDEQIDLRKINVTFFHLNVIVSLTLLTAGIVALCGFI